MNLRLKSCCCCCTTRTGTLVIGTLGWLLTLMQLFAGMDPRQQAREEKLHKELYGEDHTAYHTTIYVKIACGLVSLLVCVLLVVGVYKKDKRYMLPWLVLKGLEISLCVIGTVFVFFAACIYGILVLFIVFVILLLATALNIYFWLCIWSHYKDLGEGVADDNVAAYSAGNVPPPHYTEKAQNMA